MSEAPSERQIPSNPTADFFPRYNPFSTLNSSRLPSSLTRSGKTKPLSVKPSCKHVSMYSNSFSLGVSLKNCRNSSAHGLLSRSFPSPALDTSCWTLSPSTSSRFVFQNASNGIAYLMVCIGHRMPENSVIVGLKLQINLDAAIAGFAARARFVIGRSLGTARGDLDLI